MSLHAKITPEAIQRLQKQKRTSTISSIVISILTITLISIVLGLFLLQQSPKEIPVIITYTAAAEKETPPEPPKNTTTPEKKPASPSNSMARVITSTAPSPTSVPTPDIITDSPSVEFGESVDFGEGWGTEGFKGGGATFFQQNVKADRIAYVIDYSRSMQAKGRFPLMKSELTKSVEQLPPSIQYQLIFFAGPCWIAGDKVTGSHNAMTVNHRDKKIEWVGNGAHNWKLKDKNEKMPEAQWMKAGGSQIKNSLETIQETKLVSGTTWEPALKMALEMNPAPQIIFFMTDGDAGPSSMKVAEELGKEAKLKNITINTISLMEPKAAKQMELLADKTGGEFTMIGADGKPMNKK